jgi:hypothetical protein
VQGHHTHDPAVAVRLLASEYFEEDFLSGIMPVLFAHDCKKAEAGILANLATARRGQTLWYSRYIYSTL